MATLKQLLILIAIWIESIISLNSFREETLYMLKNDLKIIRLKDFLRGSIDTTFIFKPVDAFANNATNTTDLTIYQTKSELYNVPKSSMNISAETLLDVFTATDDIILARTLDNYHLFSIVNGSARNKITMSYAEGGASFQALFNFMHDQTQLLMFHRTETDRQVIVMQIRLLDPSKPNNITTILNSSRVEFPGVYGPKFRKYRFHSYERNTSSFLVIGASPDFTDSANPIVKCKTRFKLEGDNQMWPTECIIVNAPTGFDATFEQVLFQTIQETRIRVVARKGKDKNDYYYTDCDMNSDGTKLTCAPIKPILKIPMYNGTFNRFVDLGKGHFAVWTRQSISYSLNLEYTAFEKIYTQTPENMIQKDADYPISFATKTPTYICIGIQGVLGSPNTTSAVILEYTSAPADTYIQNMNSQYLRLQNDYLSFTEERPEGLYARGYKFIDPYIEVKGEIVSKKEGYMNTTIGLVPFRFAIEARSNTTLLQTKNFTVTLVTGALDSAELSLPFNNITLVKGGLMSVVIKEDYAIGNDLTLATTATVPGVKTKVERIEQSNVKFNQNASEATANLTKLLNDSTEAKFFEKVVMVHDNLAVVSYRRPETKANFVFVIYLRRLSNRPEVYNGELFNNVTIGEAYCQLSFGGTEPDFNYTLSKTALVNYNHLLVVMESPTKNLEKPYFAQMFNIDPLTWRKQHERAIGDRVFFKSTQSISSYILYPFPGSATIIYSREGKPDYDTSYIGMIRFFQLNDGRYNTSMHDISHDAVRIERFTHLYPDFSSKYNFYIRVVENTGKNGSYIAFVNNITSNGNTSLRLVLNRPLQSGVDLMAKSSHFCAANEEVVSIRDEENVINGTNVSLSRLYISPSKAVYPVHEKMVRRLPLESLNLLKVAFADCMEDRNSMIVFAFNDQTNRTAIVNYDFDKVSDPRRRIESVMYLPDIKPIGLLVSSKSVSSAYKDFILVSYIDEITQKRMFRYVMQPVKVFKFEVDAPMNLDQGFDLNINLTINHSLSKVSVNKSLNVFLRPLDYKTNITIDSTKKIPKKRRSYPLENGLLDIQGHIYGMQLRNVKTGSVMSPDDANVRLIKRLVRVENITMKNSVQVRCQNDFVFVRQADGDIKLFTDRKDRNKFLTIRLQSNFMASNVVPKAAISNYNTSQPDLFYLLVGEEVMNGINLRYMEIKDLPGVLEESKLMSQNLSMSFQGAHKRIDSIFCQKNLYVILLPRIQDSILVMRIDTTAKESDPFSTKIPWQLTMKFSSEISTLDIICMSDSDRGDVSLGLIVLYSNLTQVLYSLKSQIREEQLSPVTLNFFQGKNYFVNDLECESHGNKTYQVNNVQAYLTEVRCFYSTRWADDYLVYYAIETVGSESKLVQAKLIEEIEEVKNLDIVKAIVEDDWIMVVGKNLKEDYEERDYYVMIYKFEPGKSTYVKTFFSLKRSLDLDPDSFREVIDFNRDNSLVFLAKTSKSTNSYDTIYRLNITGMRLDVLTTNFDPSQIDLEFLDISNEPLYKIRLLNFFDLINEVRSLEDSKVANIIGACLGVSVFFLLASGVFYIVSNRIYVRRKTELKTSPGFNKMKTQVIRLSREFDDDRLDEDDSDGILEEIILRSQSEQTSQKS